MNKEIAIIWDTDHVSGTIEIFNSGHIISDSAGETRVQSFKTDGIYESRLIVVIGDAKVHPGSFATIVTVRAKKSFSFFLRDVYNAYPIYIKEYNVIVTDAHDERSYKQIVLDIMSNGYISKLDELKFLPEESFDTASKFTRNLPCPTWLGISRDIRLFEVSIHMTYDMSKYWDSIQPMYHHFPIVLDETGGAPVRYDYFAGRGIGCKNDTSRWLENNIYPVLNVINDDDGVKYEQKMFVTIEESPLVIENIHGTHYLVADMYAEGTIQSETQKNEALKLHDHEINQDEETILYLRVEAINTRNTPKYAYMRIPQPNAGHIPSLDKLNTSIQEGLCIFGSSGKVFSICHLNGEPFSEVESSVLLKPGEKAVYEFMIPHKPISIERACKLSKRSFYSKLIETLKFWDIKLKKMCHINLPEKRIEEMMKAGYLHLDLVCFGNEPDGIVAPVAGVYGPIGTESTPIIQYFESVGENELARRAIMYFLYKQRDDGFIQNYQTYMSETGCALWNAAEHYKYTGDIEWLKMHKDKLVLGCEYLMRWANESKNNAYRKRGYGMIYGKVADVDLPYHSYMLNSTTYAGMRSCADVLQYIDTDAANRIAYAAEELKNNILESMIESFTLAPVVPISDGTWCPLRSQFPECRGDNNLYVNGELTFSHGSIVTNIDSGHFDIAYGVVDPKSVYADFIMKSVNEISQLRSVSFSQPYYSLYPYVNLLRGETEAFLKEFYNGVSALADRETYNFWEHFYMISPFKTHGEAWFLMRCRWMLFLEVDNDLKILSGVPRNWLENGNEIAFDGMITRFGKLAVHLRSMVAVNRINVDVEITECRKVTLNQVAVRIPHPTKRKACRVSNGIYCPDSETILVQGFIGKKTFEVCY